MSEYRGGEIVGIDPATKTGIATGEPGKDPRLEVIDFRVSDLDTPDMIFQRATLWWATRLQRPPGALVIEDPVPPTKLLRKRRSDGGVDLIEARTQFHVTVIAFGLYGIFIGLAKCKGVHVVHANISAWRACFLGRGNGRLPGAVSKRKAKDACRLLGWDYQDDDNAAEAGGIWTYGVSQLAPYKMPPLGKITPLFASTEKKARVR